MGFSAPPSEPIAREPSRRPEQTQFQDILAAAARESASRRGPRAADMSREPDGWPSPDVGTWPSPGGKSPREEEYPLHYACEQCAITCAHTYLVVQALTFRCIRCVSDCGGLLRIDKKELESWGWREGEQPARYRGACGDRDMAERAMRRAQARNARRAASPPGEAGLKPVVV